MPMIIPQRWTSRSLMSVLMPHLFRRPLSAQEWLGSSYEKVPLDADSHHMHIKRKTSKFKKSVIQRYGLNLRPDADHRRKLWSVLTGEWVPEGWIQPTHIFPTSLGAMLEQEIMDSSWLWDGGNGLMLPRSVGRALHDWALAIVPTDTTLRFRTPEYKVMVLDPANVDLQVPVYANEDRPSLFGVDLDNALLSFNTPARPVTSMLYFHCCCAVWKRICLENPETTDCKEFWELFLGYMNELWGEFAVTRSQKHITEVFMPRE